jgi:hypothetical protein
VLAGGTAGVLSGIVGADITEPLGVEAGSTLATVDTGSAGGAGLGAIAGLEAGALAATDDGGAKVLVLMSAMPAKIVTTTIMHATMMRIPNLAR